MVSLVLPFFLVIVALPSRLRQRAEALVELALEIGDRLLNERPIAPDLVTTAENGCVIGPDQDVFVGMCWFAW